MPRIADFGIVEHPHSDGKEKDQTDVGRAHDEALRKRCFLLPRDCRLASLEPIPESRKAQNNENQQQRSHAVSPKHKGAHEADPDRPNPGMNCRNDTSTVKRINRHHVEQVHHEPEIRQAPIDLAPSDHK